MPKVYGSMLCPDCVEAKEYFEKVNYKYEFVNITESMQNLKEFLALRENRKEFEEVKKFGYVGIPAILTDDNKIILGDEVLEVK
ncbi:glutaredoxin domain-containing protein [uncultured Fusobacterium sp.]|uniref:glutaredoxin domain-containing protein n=1 Tax=uncultured Fusobacterium sp. TaxID=159267 RepID=UPI00262414D6|nr:glutaredoxin domain-containing protein [uncultured Fusobacterium sp.]